MDDEGSIQMKAEPDDHSETKHKNSVSVFEETNLWLSRRCLSRTEWGHHWMGSIQRLLRIDEMYSLSSEEILPHRSMLAHGWTSQSIMPTKTEAMIIDIHVNKVNKTSRCLSGGSFRR